MGKVFFDKKFLEESEYERNVFNALLVSSIKEDYSKLPRSKKAILSAIVNGTLCYLGRDAGRLRFYDFQNEKNFEKEFTKYFQDEMKKINNNEPSKIIRKINEMVQYEYSSALTSKYPTCKLYNHFRRFKEDHGLEKGPIFSVCFEKISDIEKNLKKIFNKKEREEIEKIGKPVSEYLNEYVYHIERNLN